jgi:hypothetical protein
VQNLPNATPDPDVLAFAPNPRPDEKVKPMLFDTSEASGNYMPTATACVRPVWGGAAKKRVKNGQEHEGLIESIPRSGPHRPAMGCHCIPARTPIWGSSITSQAPNTLQTSSDVKNCRPSALPASIPTSSVFSLTKAPLLRLPG